MQREREPRRLAHRAAALSRHEAESRWLAEQIEEAIDENLATVSSETVKADRPEDGVAPRP